jgi:hypothetical protein
MTRPVIGRRASGRDHRAVAELVGINHVFGKADRVHQPHRQLGHHVAPVAQHRHIELPTVDPPINPETVREEA